jgi:lysophospholipase L1-like esterase
VTGAGRVRRAIVSAVLALVGARAAPASAPAPPPDWPNLGRYAAANAALPAPAAGQARVVFMGDSITELNAWLREHAQGTGAAWVDFHTPMADAQGGLRRGYSDDGVHPNRAGYAVMNPLVEQGIRQALQAR